MGIIGRIFKPEKLIDGVVKGVDKLTDSQGEKADRFSELLKLYEPFKLAQRIIAILFTSAYLISHLTAITFIILDSKDKAEIIFQRTNDNLMYIVLAIVSFYFTGGVINGALKRFTKKTIGNKK